MLPEINLTGEEVIKDSLPGRRLASVMFYFDAGDIDYSNAVLSISFIDETGNYLYKDIDFYAIDYERGKWNLVSLEIPVSELKKSTDTVKIQIWSPHFKREMLIDELQYGIVLSQ